MVQIIEFKIQHASAKKVGGKITKSAENVYLPAINVQVILFVNGVQMK